MRKLLSMMARVAAVLTVATAVGGSGSWAQTGEEKKGDSPHSMSQEDMKKMMEMGAPGPQHQHMAILVGTWKTSIKMWMGPGEATVTTGATTYELLLGGRYVMGKHTGAFNNMPFEGIGIDGYDNAQKEYFTFWIDNMSTGSMYLTGQPSADGNGITYKGSSFDPMQGREVKVREEVRWSDDRHYTFTMFMEMPGPDGQSREMQVMEITAEKQ